MEVALWNEANSPDTKKLYPLVFGFSAIQHRGTG
jgi:hypothetical protein